MNVFYYYFCRYGGQLVDEEHSRSWLGYGNREQCTAALTKMRQCSWCDGKDAKPCHGLCVNVIRGCLARETAHLDAPWTGYYEAVDRLVSAINNGQSSVCLEDLLRSLHSRISEAIMYAMSHASDIQNNVSSILRIIHSSDTFVEPWEIITGTYFIYTFESLLWPRLI
jgi:hypothetical protein